VRFPALDHPITGVSVPVAALRSGLSCGVGEFSDLPLLGAWCKHVGLELIQLLPVNDTAGNSSPYSAVSAFALHPLYLRLQDVPGAERHLDEIAAFQRESGEAPPAPGGRSRFSYPRVLAFKRSFVERSFVDQRAAIEADPAFRSWREANPWVASYAVFCALKRQTAEAAWETWGELADPTPERIQAWWTAHPEQCLPAAWMQYLLAGQLAQASGALARLGVWLKGDIPILMSRESADVWAQRRYFDLTAQAGAPPDMFSPDGQNWGFPVYDWEALRRDGLAWWKERLRTASRFFHAFRIDHVLGFFRIWSIPRGETTGLLGHFSPSVPLPAEELRSRFDEGRIRWLSLPHVSGAELAAGLGPDASRVAASYLRRVAAEDLYTLPEELGEGAIDRLVERPEVKRFLRSWHANRALVQAADGGLYPAWYADRSKGFGTLSDSEKQSLRDMMAQSRAASEQVWEARGRALLTELRDSTDMLVCAEDLGDVPRIVPEVLADLGILGLRIVRWSRDWDRAGPGTPAPFVPPERYPWLSVCTPSVHDTSTLRGWWEEDAADPRDPWVLPGADDRASPPGDRSDLSGRGIGPLHPAGPGSARSGSGALGDRS